MKNTPLTEEQWELRQAGKPIRLTEEQRQRLWWDPPAPKFDRTWYQKFRAELAAKQEKEAQEKREAAQRQFEQEQAALVVSVDEILPRKWWKFWR
jgi:hypothetical protein